MDRLAIRSADNTLRMKTEGIYEEIVSCWNITVDQQRNDSVDFGHDVIVDETGRPGI